MTAAAVAGLAVLAPAAADAAPNCTFSLHLVWGASGFLDMRTADGAGQQSAAVIQATSQRSALEGGDDASFSQAIAPAGRQQIAPAKAGFNGLVLIAEPMCQDASPVQLMFGTTPDLNLTSALSLAGAGPGDAGATLTSTYFVSGPSTAGAGMIAAGWGGSVLGSQGQDDLGAGALAFDTTAQLGAMGPSAQGPVGMGAFFATSNGSGSSFGSGFGGAGGGGGGGGGVSGAETFNPTPDGGASAVTGPAAPGQTDPGLPPTSLPSTGLGAAGVAVPEPGTWGLLLLGFGGLGSVLRARRSRALA